MMPGETIHSGASAVCDCGTKFNLEPMESAAGWYVGTRCHNKHCKHYGEPNSRESHYYRNEESVVVAMTTGNIDWRT